MGEKEHAKPIESKCDAISDRDRNDGIFCSISWERRGLGGTAFSRHRASAAAT
jgi:hypothetical protein